jgi:type IV fimbrial biogenesis protein FimT
MGRKPSGFTLLETAAAVAVVAVAVAVGVPSFAGGLERQRVATAMHRLSADMATARSTALARRTQVVVCPGEADAGCRQDRDWSGGWLVFRDDDGNRQPDDTTDILRISDAPGGAVGVLRLVSTRPHLRFQKNGRSAHSNLSVVVCARGRLHGKVVVNRLGRVRGERSEPSVPCPIDPGR